MISSPVKGIVVKLLREYADNIESGNTNLSGEEATHILSIIAHIELTKEEAMKELHLKRSRFDDLVRDGIIPRGKKILGRKELVWYKDELPILGSNI